MITHYGLDLDQHIWQVADGVVRDLVRAADRASAEAVFIACTNVPTFDLIADMEAELGKPVLTANQVSLWAALGPQAPAARARTRLFG